MNARKINRIKKKIELLNDPAVKELLKEINQELSSFSGNTNHLRNSYLQELTLLTAHTNSSSYRQLDLEEAISAVLAQNGAVNH